MSYKEGIVAGTYELTDAVQVVARPLLLSKRIIGLTARTGIAG